MKKVYSLVLMLSLFGSMAFAKDKTKPEGSPSAKQAVSASQDPACGADTKKNKGDSESAPTDQEKEFNRVLLGIYG